MIEISSYHYVQLRLDVTLNFWSFMGDNPDYIRAYYKLDGGPETLFYERNDFFDVGDNQEVISGSNVQIIIKVQNDDYDFFGTRNDVFTLDNAQVTEVSTLYSMQNGSWDNGTVWSANDYTETQYACDCTPTTSEKVVIRHTVDMNTNGVTKGLKIENNGNLNYMSNSDVTITKGGNVVMENNGSIVRNGRNARLVFGTDGVTSEITIDNTSTIDIRDLVINGTTTLNISGSGTLNVDRDVIITNAASSSVINNDFVGQFNIGRDLKIHGSNIQFINNNSLTITNNLFFNRDNSAITNNSILTIKDLTVNNSGDNNNSLTNNTSADLNILGNIDLSNSNFIINNFGTIDQNGNFEAIDNGSDFYNQNGATWNFSGNNFDNSMSNVLSCDNGTNTFNYNRTGNQDVITPIDAYSVLTVSNTGTKSLQGNIMVKDNLNISDAASLNSDNNNINLSGNWNNTSTGSFNAGNGLVTFDGNTDQHIINTMGNETFYALELNKENGGLVLQDDVTISNAMTFTKGIVKTTNSELLIIADNATANLNLNSYVYGPVSKIGDDDFIFPIGKNGILAPAVITGIVGSSTTQFTAEYFTDPAPNPTNLPASGLSHVSAIEYWDLERVSSDNAKAIVGLGTLDKDRSEIYDGTNEDAIIAHYDESTNEWERL